MTPQQAAWLADAEAEIAASTLFHAEWKRRQAKQDAANRIELARIALRAMADFNDQLVSHIAAADLLSRVAKDPAYKARRWYEFWRK